MAIKIEWKPVLQPLMLKDYHPEYGDEKIMICVNPQPAFWQEREALLREYRQRNGEISLLQKRAEISQGDAVEAGRKATEAYISFIEWGETSFVPSMLGWFARLWSLGGEPYMEDDIRQFQEIDPHLLTWLQTRSIEMIETHASARKKV
jgi:hypothetical protein